MSFPSGPNECYKLLKQKYSQFKGGIIDKADWAVWSGEFNRHVRGKLKVCGPKKDFSFRLLFSIWQCYNRIIFGLYPFGKKDQELDLLQEFQREFKKSLPRKRKAR